MKHSLFFLLVLVIFTLTSCNLDFFPSDEVTSESLVNDVSGLEYMTDGNYAMLKDNMEYQGSSSTSYTFIRRAMEMAEFPSDEILVSGRTTSTLFQAYTYERTPDLQNVSYVWWCCYKCIFGANTVIEAIKEGESVENDYLKGENLFLRAFCHLWLCNLYAWPYSYGRENPGVILRTSTNTENTKRATVGEVYDQIVIDLQDAIRLMSAGTRRGNAGYASKEAAQGLLTRVYLHMEENDKVVELVNEMLGGDAPSNKIMSTAEYPDYFANTLTSKETLWAIAYTTVDGGALGQSLLAGMFLNDPVSGLGWGEEYPSDPMLDLFERYPHDLRYTCFIHPQYSGVDKWIVRYPIKGVDNRDARANQLSEAIQNADGTFTFPDEDGNTCVASQEIVNTYPLYFATIKGEKIQVHVTKQMKQRGTYPNYYVSKFSYQDGLAMLASPAMIRWAEVILNRAEAYAKLGRQQEALDDVNVIRSRAGLSGEELMTLSNMGARGYENVLAVVLDERHLELAFEGFRTLDVYRNKLDMDRRYAGVHAWEIVDHNDPKILYPIPFDEISVSGIPQNPGY